MTLKITGTTVVNTTLEATFDGMVVTEGNYLSVNTLPPLSGTVAGYTGGGYFVSPGVSSNRIDKFPFSTDTNATTVGNLTQARHGIGGQSSDINGYTSGGQAPPTVNTIDKFPFAANANATDVGDLTQARDYAAGQSSSINGYSSGGKAFNTSNRIDKFPFAVDANATTVGDLLVSRDGPAGQSSAVSGYTSGGRSFGTDPFASVATIDKFPFSVNANATSVGSLSQSRRGLSGQSSNTHGYSSGGSTPSGALGGYTRVDKFPFSADASAVLVGNLGSGWFSAGQSSTSQGYSSGGRGINEISTIKKFSFSSDGEGSTVGNLTQARSGGSGTQD